MGNIRGILSMASLTILLFPQVILAKDIHIFDFDDTILRVVSKIYLFDKNTGEAFAVTTGEFALIRDKLGVAGSSLEDFEFRLGINGSAKNFYSISGENRARTQVQEVVDKFPKEYWQADAWQEFKKQVSSNVEEVYVLTGRTQSPADIYGAFKYLEKNNNIRQAPFLKNIIPVGFLYQDVEEMKLENAKLIELGKIVNQRRSSLDKSMAHKVTFWEDDPRNIEKMKKGISQALGTLGYVQFEYRRVNDHYLDENEIVNRLLREKSLRSVGVGCVGSI